MRDRGAARAVLLPDAKARPAGMRYVPAAMAPVVTAYLSRGEQVEAALAEISAINVELLARRELG